MKKSRFITLLLVVFLSLTACNKVSHNGNLDGQWRIITIENIESGVINEPQQLFYCFNLHTANLTRGGVWYTANMVYDYPKLSLDFPYNKPGELDDWGIYSTDVTFQIVLLNSSSLILRSDQVIINLQKF